MFAFQESYRERMQLYIAAYTENNFDKLVIRSNTSDDFCHKYQTQGLVRWLSRLRYLTCSLIPGSHLMELTPKPCPL